MKKGLGGGGGCQRGQKQTCSQTRDFAFFSLFLDTFLWTDHVNIPQKDIIMMEDCENQNKKKGIIMMGDCENPKKRYIPGKMHIEQLKVCFCKVDHSQKCLSTKVPF